MVRQARWIDGAAIGLSSLCLAHCLLFPLAVAALPLLASVLTLPETVHEILALAAAPLSALAIAPVWRLHRRHEVSLLAVCGVGCLLAVAFLEPLATAETELTVAGAMMLATAHGLNWRFRLRNALDAPKNHAML